MEPLAHASMAFIAKPLIPEAPLWALVAATQVPDLLSFAFFAAGIEHGAETQVDFTHGLQYLSQPLIPWSHGLVMCCLWSLLAGGIAYLISHNRRVSIAIGLMVISHWLLDFIVYPNQPLLFSSTPAIGLGLITSPAGLIAGILLEIGLIAGGGSTYVIYRKRGALQARI